MAVAPTVVDEAIGGGRRREFTIELAAERVTVRDLIIQRVVEEVKAYNASTDEYFHGLVQPTDAELTLNGFRFRKRRRSDWRKQCDAALEAFGKNGYFMLVGERQVESLDEELLVDRQTKVAFIKLIPLVGG